MAGSNAIISCVAVKQYWNSGMSTLELGNESTEPGNKSTGTQE